MGSVPKSRLEKEKALPMTVREQPPLGQARSRSRVRPELFQPQRLWENRREGSFSSADERGLQGHFLRC